MPGKRDEDQETSVVVSLQDLTRLGQARVREEHDEAVKRTEAIARAQAEERARDEAAAEQRRQDAEAQRLRQEQEQRLAYIQIEAAKLAEIETRKMAVQHRMHMELLQKERAHELELARLSAARPGGRGKAFAFFALGLSAVLCAVLAYVTVVAPRREARAAADRAATIRDEQAALAKTRDDELRTYRQTIDALRERLRVLEQTLVAQDPPKPTATTTAVAKPPAPVVKPPAVTNGGCPPGVHGVPLCP